MELWARNCPVILPKYRLPLKFRDLLYAANLRHGTDGFTSPPKEGVLRIFSIYIYIYDSNILSSTTERPVLAPIYQKELSKLWMCVFSTLFFITLETAKQRLMN